MAGEGKETRTVAEASCRCTRAGWRPSALFGACRRGAAEGAARVRRYFGFNARVMTYPTHRHDMPRLSDTGMLGFFGAASARIHVPVHRWCGWHRASAALLAATIGWGALMPFTLRNGERSGHSTAGGARPVMAGEAARLRAEFALELARITSIERSEALRSPVIAAASLSDGDLIDLLGGLAADAALKIERFKPIGGSDD